jgi:hypothetical protein
MLGVRDQFFAYAFMSSVLSFKFVKAGSKAAETASYPCLDGTDRNIQMNCYLAMRHLIIKAI